MPAPEGSPENHVSSQAPDAGGGLRQVDATGLMDHISQRPPAASSPTETAVPPQPEIQPNPAALSEIVDIFEQHHLPLTSDATAEDIREALHREASWQLDDQTLEYIKGALAARSIGSEVLAECEKAGLHIEPTDTLETVKSKWEKAMMEVNRKYSLETGKATPASLKSISPGAEEKINLAIIESKARALKPEEKTTEEISAGVPSATPKPVTTDVAQTRVEEQQPSQGQGALRLLREAHGVTEIPKGATVDDILAQIRQNVESEIKASKGDNKRVKKLKKELEMMQTPSEQLVHTIELAIDEATKSGGEPAGKQTPTVATAEPKQITEAPETICGQPTAEPAESPQPVEAVATEAQPTAAAETLAAAAESKPPETPASPPAAPAETAVQTTEEPQAPEAATQTPTETPAPVEAKAEGKETVLDRLHDSFLCIEQTDSDLSTNAWIPLHDVYTLFKGKIDHVRGIRAKVEENLASGQNKDQAIENAVQAEIKLQALKWYLNDHQLVDRIYTPDFPTGLSEEAELAEVNKRLTELEKRGEKPLDSKEVTTGRYAQARMQNVDWYDAELYFLQALEEGTDIDTVYITPPTDIPLDDPKRHKLRVQQASFWTNVAGTYEERIRLLAQRRHDNGTITDEDLKKAFAVEFPQPQVPEPTMPPETATVSTTIRKPTTVEERAEKQGREAALKAQLAAKDREIAELKKQLDQTPDERLQAAEERAAAAEQRVTELQQQMTELQQTTQARINELQQQLAKLQTEMDVRVIREAGAKIKQDRTAMLQAARQWVEQLYLPEDQRDKLLTQFDTQMAEATKTEPRKGKPARRKQKQTPPTPAPDEEVEAPGPTVEPQVNMRSLYEKHSRARGRESKDLDSQIMEMNRRRYPEMLEVTNKQVLAEMRTPDTELNRKSQLLFSTLRQYDTAFIRNLPTDQWRAEISRLLIDFNDAVHAIDQSYQSPNIDKLLERLQQDLEKEETQAAGPAPSPRPTEPSAIDERDAPEFVKNIVKRREQEEARRAGQAPPTKPTEPAEDKLEAAELKTEGPEEKTPVAVEAINYDFIERLAPFLEGTTTPRASIIVSPDALAQYLPSVRLPEKVGKNARLNNVILELQPGDGDREPAVLTAKAQIVNSKAGSPEITVKFTNAAGGGLQLAAPLELPRRAIRAQAVKGQIQDNIGSLHTIILEDLNQKLPAGWRATNVHIEKDGLVFNFERTEPTIPVAPPVSA